MSAVLLPYMAIESDCYCECSHVCAVCTLPPCLIPTTTSYTRRPFYQTSCKLSCTHSPTMAPNRQSATSNRGWWREYFLDHPGLKAKLPEVFTGTGSSAKAKVYCSKCFENNVSAVLSEDQCEVNAVPPLQQSVCGVPEIERHCTVGFSSCAI